MKKIVGIGNWKIEYEIINQNKIKIIKALTCDENVMVPNEINGYPVVALGDYALAAKHTENSFFENENSIEILGNGFIGEWNNKKIKSIVLPKSIESIGNYCFMGCFNLHSLEMQDGVLRWGHSVFMNCMSICRITINREGYEGNCLYNICIGIDRELIVKLNNPNNSCTKVFFPEYAETWEENTPARQFNPSMEGLGYPYHHAFKDKKIDWNLYDGIWNKAKTRGRAESLLIPISWLRICYPESLEDRYKENYMEYIKNNKKKLMDWVIKNEPAESVKKLLEIVDFTPEEIKEYSEIARENGNTSLLAILIGDNKDKKPLGRVKTFEL